MKNIRTNEIISVNIGQQPTIEAIINKDFVPIGGKPGKDGATFIPFVSDEGVISWTNDKDLLNPDPVNIMGPQGPQGPQGNSGRDGFSPKLSLSNEKAGVIVTVENLNGIESALIRHGQNGENGKDGVQGLPGKDGANGKSAYQYAVEAGYKGTEQEFAEKLANNGGINFTTDETLSLANGVLSVNTTQTVEQDNTLPITAGAVFNTVGNIKILLETI